MSSASFPDIEIIYSLAGRTQNPKEYFGRVITGGFGGVSGIKNFIKNEKIDLIIDATHPFSQTISQNSHDACAEAGILRVNFSRPTWAIPENKKIAYVKNIDAAKHIIEKKFSRIFLTTGQSKINAFKHLKDTWFLIRLIEMPSNPILLQNYKLILTRPPYGLQNEKSLLLKHKIDCLVSKNSGGIATEAKINAAINLDIHIILIKRPPKIPGLYFNSIFNCTEWLKSII